MGEALDKIAPGDAGECPDAELIAAYHERSLDPDEIAGCETHFAACARCRKILAVLAASDDTPLAAKEVARLGELLAATGSPQQTVVPITKPGRPRRFDWRARWLAPALGVAAVLAVWFAMRPPWHAVDRSPSGTLIAQAPANEPLAGAVAPSVDHIPNLAPTNKLETKPATPPLNPKVESAAGTESSKPVLEAPTAKNLDGIRPMNRLASGVRSGEHETETRQSAEVNNSAPTLPVTPPPVPMTAFGGASVQAQSDSAQKAVTSAPEMPKSTGQSITATAQAEVVTAANGTFSSVVNQGGTANVPLTTRNYTNLLGLAGGTEGTILIESPSGMSFWRAGIGGGIEKSTDAGKTWRKQTSPVQEDWLAGAAASDTVCWLVGRNGAIAKTTNGKRWKRISSPQQAAASGKLPNWVNVMAIDARTATIMAADQSHFLTQDGGKTWRAQ
jgi:hypothetical protein